MFAKDLWSSQTRVEAESRETSITLSRRLSVIRRDFVCGCPRPTREKKKNDKWNIFHMKEDDACKRVLAVGASSITVNPWSKPSPAAIREISFHRSLSNRSIKLCLFLLESCTQSREALYMQITPLRWLFTAFPEMGVNVSSFLWTYPTIYVCGFAMHG